MTGYSFKALLSFLILTLYLLPLISCSSFYPSPKKNIKRKTEEKERIIRPNSPLIPRDKYGVIDWSELLRQGYIAPLSTIRPDPSKQALDDIDYSVTVWSSEVKNKHESHSFTVPLKPVSLPENKFNRLQWSEVIRRGIDPIASIDENAPDEINITVTAKKGYMADVAFPHSVHSYWLSCDNCHPAIFNRKSWGLTMDKILHGEYCGRCHDKVAFPIRECYRCHMERPKTN